MFADEEKWLGRETGHNRRLIDVHGDLAEAALRYVPRHRTLDVTYFDAGDRDHPLGYNPLRCRSQHERPHVGFKKLELFRTTLCDAH